MNIFGLSGVTRVLVATAIALVPALVVYIRGRKVARFIDDPAAARAAPRRPTGYNQLVRGLLVCALPALAFWAGDRAWIVAVAVGTTLTRYVLTSISGSLAKHLRVTPSAMII